MELEDDIFRYLHPRARGMYRPEDKRIFLRRDFWCRNTLIHETLHALSHFAREPRVGNTHYFLRESLNEFVTGYVLWKIAPECYDSWRRKDYELFCALGAFEPQVKTWYAFCHFISFEEVKKIHFGDPEKRWNQIWQDFCMKIPKRGSRRFQVHIGSHLQERFHQECKKHFRDFERIYEMESEPLDYNSLKYDPVLK